MKIFPAILFLLVASCSSAQRESFDIATFIAPKNWKKETKTDFVQFSKEDPTKGIYCLVTFYKSIDGAADAKANFAAAWESVVKETLGTTAEPEMQAPVDDNGWNVQSGYAAFEKEGNKGVAMLIASTCNSKLVNILILTNTDAYQAETTKMLESVDLKKNKVADKKNEISSNDLGPDNIQRKEGYKFTTTNFDDGWTAVEKADWVEVSKENIKVLLHYPQKGTVFPADPEPLTNAAWNILVAPRYSNLKNYKTSYISSYIRGYLGMGYMQDNTTKSNLFVLLFRQSDGWIECIAPDKKTFIQQFKFDPEAMRWDSEMELVKPLDAMSSYNKFAVAASDLNGTGIWSSSFASNTYYTNIYTGNSAGMSTYTSGEDYTFLAGQKFKWSIVAANSHSGTTKFAQDKAEGSWKMNTDWEIGFNKSGKLKRYSAFFSCIKGTRLLHLLDADYRGSGVYTIYGKK